jgi:hypothetical protein
MDLLLLLPCLGQTTSFMPGFKADLALRPFHLASSAWVTPCAWLMLHRLSPAHLYWILPALRLASCCGLLWAT